VRRKESPEDVQRIVALRASGLPWHRVDAEMGWVAGRAYRAVKVVPVQTQMFCPEPARPWEALYILTVDGQSAGTERGISTAMEHGRQLVQAGAGVVRIREDGTGDTWVWDRGFRRER
jgi:hypothetical protein